MSNKQKGLTVNCLFIIAYALLFINEFTYVYRDCFGLNNTLNEFQWFITRPYSVILFFLLAESMRETKNRKKIIFGLLITAIVTEFAYDYAFNNTILELGDQSDMFDLLISALAIVAYDKFDDNKSAQSISIIVLCAISCICNFSNNVQAIITTLAFYILHDNKNKSYIVAVLIVVTSFVLHTVYFLQARDAFSDYLYFAIQQAFAAFAVPIVAKYNGQLGKKLPSWLYYVVYPGIIVVLILIFKL